MTTPSSPDFRSTTTSAEGDRTIIGEPGDTVSPPGKPGGSQKWIGRTLGHCRLTGVLGGGGMGVVYRGRDEVIERDVAVKVLSPDLADDPTALARFLSEAKAAGQLNHPNVVGLYDVNEQDGTQYLVMELVTGGSLAAEVRRIGQLSPLAATRATVEAARGLSAAHAAGMVHRDIKPANLLRTADGAVKVCDFGLAKESLAERGMTRTGHVVGTPYYMSPEQCEGRPVDARSDIYSLGATYYYLLTGSEPYAQSGSTMQVMFAHCHGDPLDPRATDSLVPDSCAKIILCATAKDPANRYQTTAEMIADLETALAAFSGGRSAVRTTLGLSSADGAGLRTASATVRTTVAPLTSEAVPRQRPARSRPAVVAAVLALLLLLGGGAYLWNRTLPVEPNDAAPNFAAVNGMVTGDDAVEGVATTVAGGPAVAVAAAGEPIRVGILHSLSGTMADSESPLVDAARLAIDEVNRNGGIQGRPVEAVVADGRSDPAVFLSEATRLIDDEQVAAIFGCWTSASRRTIVPLLEERDHLLIYPVQYEGLEESPNVVYTGAAPNQQILPAVQWARESLDAETFFIVGSDYVFPRVAAEIIKDAVPQFGSQIVGEFYLPLGARDASAAVAAIQAAQPDVLLNLVNGDTNVALFQDLHAAGEDLAAIPAISFSVHEEELRRLDLASVAGDYAAWNYFEAIDSPENAAFLKVFHEKYGPQRRITDPMEAAYVGVKLWAQAANEAQSIAPRAVRASIRSQRLAAPHGPVRVDAASQHLYKTPRIGQISDAGEFVIVWSAPAPVAPESYPASRTAEAWRAFLHDLQRGWNGRWAAPPPEK